MIKKLLTSACLSLFIASPVLAEGETWYKVEVLAFANQDSSYLDDEYWPDIKPEISEDAIQLNPQPEELISDEELDAYTLTPASELSLLEERQRVVRSRDYRLLFHEAWIQPVIEGKKLQPVIIQGGDLLPPLQTEQFNSTPMQAESVLPLETAIDEQQSPAQSAQPELDGTIAIGRGRYLHFRPQLYLTRDLSAEESEMLLKFKEDEALMDDTLAMSSSSAQPSLSEVGASEAVATLSEVQQPKRLTVKLDQARRMRSNEPHYIDHPLMGLIVIIERVEPDTL